ncbi:FAD-dependent oxidoreductase [Streptomyces sp. NPDC056390]|uniref:FAD-dependent oxidoreductase n=1 Tax=Streptomyces sp. NPDC056390 TaxID=3345806 RepID=UPI0035E2C44B
MTAHDASDPAPRLAIVGSGPAGCYLAQHLSRRVPDAEIVIFDRLATPYGLFRYGVAPDHQGTKTTAKQFDRLFEKRGVVFVGSVEVGTDLPLETLTELFDVTVLATGLSQDRPLGVPGGDLPQVLGAGRLVRFLNGHPDEYDNQPRIEGDVIVVGLGNVAVDVVRLLAKTDGELDGSDADPDVWERTVGPIRSITVVSRSGPDAVKADASMLRELADLRRARFAVLGLDDDGSESAAAQALLDLAPTSSDGDLAVTFLLNTTPVEVDGAHRVTAVRVRSGDGVDELAADTVITAIGFLPENPVTELPRVHRAGWLAHGPVGAIPVHRARAAELADAIVAELAREVDRRPRPGVAGLPADLLKGATTFEGWRRIDAAETASPPAGRVRRKLRSAAELADVAHGRNTNESGTEH